LDQNVSLTIVKHPLKVSNPSRRAGKILKYSALVLAILPISAVTPKGVTLKNATVAIRATKIPPT
jgi:hypothetical protein